VAFNPHEETYRKSIQILKSENRHPFCSPFSDSLILPIHFNFKFILNQDAMRIYFARTEITSRSGTIRSRLRYIDLHANARPARSSANTSGVARKSAHAPCRSFPTSVLLPARVTLEPRSKLDPPLYLPLFLPRGLQRDFRSIGIGIRISQQGVDPDRSVRFAMARAS